MQTQLDHQYTQNHQGQQAERILRNCVHCGFCTATCPTYQLLGDELDGPRGRIYLIKQVLEGQPVSAKTQTHLDRCLTCRACETTCPSGVQYGRLLDYGRQVVEQQVGRSLPVRLQRFALRKLLPYPTRVKWLLKLGHLLQPMLSNAMQRKLPPRQPRKAWPQQTHQRRMIAFQGCVQSVATPETSRATASVLNKLGIQLIDVRQAGCCGAVSHHLSAHEEGLNFVRRNIDALWPHLQQGAEAIVVSASGCGAMLKEYGDLLADDPVYADKARQVAECCKDAGEILAAETLPRPTSTNTPRIAFHSPCTLQHGQQLAGVVESVLQAAGFELVPVTDGHLCCGSAGTYSILQPELSQRLLHNKLEALQQPQPDVIATANIGCQLHLASASQVPVRHWIELLDEQLG